WGSCNHKKGYINLSLNLVKKDLKFIEYVVLHELTHLIYPHHRNEFYAFIAKIMPDFKERIKTAKI
ncbi:MAG: M48 family metallopeptidase, partial [Campylobacter sp.]|nr:M48 family metallopeptidase [Campylobacter sp.]